MFNISELLIYFFSELVSMHVTCKPRAMFVLKDYSPRTITFILNIKD